MYTVDNSSPYLRTKYVENLPLLLCAEPFYNLNIINYLCKYKYFELYKNKSMKLQKINFFKVKILDSERSDECIDFTMMCVFFKFFFVSVITF